MKPCPNCAQLIETTDFKCPYCQKTLARTDENFLKFRLFITLVFAFTGAFWSNLAAGLLPPGIWEKWEIVLLGTSTSFIAGYLYGLTTFSIRTQSFLTRILVGTFYGMSAGLISGAYTASIVEPIAIIGGGFYGAISGLFLGIIFSAMISFIRKKRGQQEQKFAKSKKTDLIVILIQFALFVSFVIQYTIYLKYQLPESRLKSSAEDIYSDYNSGKNLGIPEKDYDKPPIQEISPEQKKRGQAMRYKSSIKNGEYQKAIDSLNTLLDLESNSPYLRKSLLTQRGDLLMVTDKYQDALNDYTEALQIIRTLQNGTVPENQSYISEGSSLNLLRRGTAYRKLGLFDQALVDLSTAIAEKPTERLLTESYLQRGLTYKAINDNERFQNDFKEVSKHWENIAEGFYALDGSHWFQYGPFTWYNEDGTPKVECNYQNAEVVGTCKYFNPDGSVK